MVVCVSIEDEIIYRKREREREISELREMVSLIITIS